MDNLCTPYAQAVGIPVDNSCITYVKPVDNFGGGGPRGYCSIVTVPSGIQNSRKLGLTTVSSCVL